MDAVTGGKVNSANSQESLDGISDLLLYLRRKKVSLWSENGHLRYKAPKHALTVADIERLRLSRDQIAAHLAKTVRAETDQLNADSGPEFGSIPLAFSQLAHWHTHDLPKRRSLRNVASATRLRGRLHVDALQRGFAEIVRRHNALRTRIVIREAIPMQEIMELGDYALKVTDLMELSSSCRAIEVQRCFDRLTLSPIDVCFDPLFVAQLLRIREDEHVLIVAMEHIISDAASMNILLKELFVAYRQAVKGHAFSWPEVPLQFSDYAIGQRKAQNSWVEKHGAYWEKRLTGCQRLRFPVDQTLTAAGRSGRGLARFQIDMNLKEELREWSRRRRTTVVMSVFTAYVGLVLRWCNVSEAVILHQIDGRVGPGTENAIGYFASVLYLRIQMGGGDSFLSLMEQIKEEYCNAYQHADFSHIAAQVPEPEFTRNSCFNWQPKSSKIDLDDLDGSENAITSSPIRIDLQVLENLHLDAEPEVCLIESDSRIDVGVWFPRNLYSNETIERFGRNFLMFIRELLTHSEQRVAGVLLL
jgi:hypothetical protein